MGGRPFGTVRARLTVLATVVVAVVLLVSAVWLVAVQQRLLTHGISESLRQRADNVQTGLAQLAPGAHLPGEGDQEDSFLQLIDATGRVLAASANAVGRPPATAPLEAEASQVIRRVDGVPFRDGEFLVLARRVQSNLGPATLVVGKNLDDVNESVRILTVSLTVSLPLILALLVALLWWHTGRVLRPVEAIRAEAASIQGHELDRRLPLPGSHDEITRLARTMNAMLDRVEHATERQRLFVADASHELRTPLTRIRSVLEVGIAHPETLDADGVQSLLADATQLQELVDDLLFLARSESGAMGHRSAPVDLDDLVLEEAQRLGRRGLVNVDTNAVSAARSIGDPKQLARAIRNLASNAERHAASAVIFELREQDGHAQLVVADDGPGIPAAYHATVFERFTRLDEARSRDAGGAGLGLAIVQDIVMRHGGTISIASSGQGARFVMTLPRAD
jgi:signal transduction histidine kinase